jgi:hypothetical protein
MLSSSAVLTKAAPVSQLTDPAVARHRHPAGSGRRLLAGRTRQSIAAGLVIAVAGLAVIAAMLMTGSSPAGTDTAASRSAARTSLNRAYRQLDSVLAGFQTQTAACGLRLSCITALDRQAAQAFGSFSASLAGQGIPARFAAQGNALTLESARAESDFRELAAIRSAPRYEAVEVSLGLQATLSQWRADFTLLESRLANG